MSSLYEINRAMLALLEEHTDPETGELAADEDFFEAVAGLQMEREEKLENIVLWIKDLRAEVSAIRDEETRLKSRREKKERLADRLTNLLDVELDGDKFETARCAVSFRRSVACVIDDEGELIRWAMNNGRDDLLSYREPTIRKGAVGTELKAGAEVPGAHIEERRNVQVK